MTESQMQYIITWLNRGTVKYFTVHWYDTTTNFTIKFAEEMCFPNVHLKQTPKVHPEGV